MFNRIQSLIDRFRPLTVIADPTDDTITFSPSLCRRTRVFHLDKPEAVVFRTPDGAYGFCFATDDLPKDTATWPVQYNSHYHTVGFSCPQPTVNRIFYDYAFPPMAPRRIRIAVCKAGDLVYYKMRPDRSRPFSFNP